eukprot:49662_1
MADLTPPAPGNKPPILPAANPTKKKNSKQAMKKGQPQVSSTFATKSMAECAKLLTVETETEKTNFFLDFQSVLDALNQFSLLIRDQHRRPHPVRKSYSGMFMKSFAAKIQAVGIATKQIRVSQDLLIETTGIILPTTMNHYIAQFGKVIDADQVEISPLVTQSLVEYLNHFANLLLQYNMPGQVANLCAPANHQNFIERAYGDLAQKFIGMTKLKTLLNMDYIASDEFSVDGLIRMSHGIYTRFLASQNPPIALTADQLGAILANDVLSAPFLQANNAPVVNAITPVVWVQAVVAVKALMNHNVDWTGGNLPAALITQASAVLANAGSLRGDIAYLKKTFNVAEPVVNDAGTLAPLVTVDTQARFASASTGIRSVPERDYVAALCLVGSTVQIWKDNYGTIFNISTLASSRLRYSTSKMSERFSTLQMQLFDECLK